MNLRYPIITNFKALIDGTWPIKKIIDSFENWDKDRQNQFVEKKLHQAVSYAYEHVPYYSELFSKHSLHPNHITSISDLSKIPVLTKDSVRKHKDRLCSKELKNLSYSKRRSGGTTGEPIESLLTKEARAFETFTFLRGLYRMGWRPEMTFIQVFGGTMGVQKKTSIRAKVYDFMMKSLYIPAFELHNANIHRYYELFLNHLNICLIGYPSALNNLVELLKTEQLQTQNVKIIITTSEQLIEDWKINIQNYFNAPIRSYYGCGEIGSLGYQRLGERHEYFIPIENAIIESEENTNELIITQLHNKAQPLLRYKNGDVGMISTDSRKIKKLVGRTADFFTRSDGSLVSPIFGTHSILNSKIPVTKYQYLQYKDGSIEFRYTMEKTSLNESQKSVIKKIVSYVMNEDTPVKFVNSNEFILSSNGKHRICVRVQE